jgi:hypothetical protein
MSKIHKRTLSTEGKAEVGHIFTDGYVPVQEYTPRGALLLGLSEDATDYQRVFLVDWASLTEAQQFLVLEYMAQKFGEPEQVIRADLQERTFFPIRAKWVIESYDMRHFM